MVEIVRVTILIGGFVATFILLGSFMEYVFVWLIGEGLNARKKRKLEEAEKIRTEVQD